MGGLGSGIKNKSLRAAVKRLLMKQNPRLGYAEIGAQCGVSRQRVQQLAKEFGVTRKILPKDEVHEKQ